MYYLIACNNGTYGLNCKQNCSLNCTDGLCNSVDGSCNQSKWNYFYKNILSIYLIIHYLAFNCVLSFNRVVIVSMIDKVTFKILFNWTSGKILTT